MLLGDHCFKKNLALSKYNHAVIYVPSMMRTTCHPGDMVLLACDGIFEQTNCEKVAKKSRPAFLRCEGSLI